ncbi:CaiB/BaiF CoA transferase family protein [Metapseudomonas resinovorans]|uniref:CaiB/BaiF CoA transferase family protein n=1 Tax=Metapseudomonas resinovorans TaxID=53412 RepID=UPI0003FFF484|nr:CaiB/BaiF CoA-transferase family protein [Pseudomonas resinovorans]
MKAQGPLRGIRVLEFTGMGPAPFCAMLLSDMGAEVLRVDRKGGMDCDTFCVESRGRRSVALDLKKPEGCEAALRLISRADVLLEGFRPGVMERLGLGPEIALAVNPALIYGRMTGWGQSGPLAQSAGHDINYIALAGALHAIGTAERPAIPLNLVGDFGGGALYLAMGVLAALLHVRAGGGGQVVDCAMVDGVASLLGMIYGHLARAHTSPLSEDSAVNSGTWQDKRASNVIDGGAHFYNTYECADGRQIAIASIEPAFYAELIRLLELPASLFDEQMDRDSWPALQAHLTELFLSRTRQDWCELLEGTDVCFAPVLSLEEAPMHPHNLFRETFIERDGFIQPAPAPRFSETPGAIQGPPPRCGADNREALGDWGFSDVEIAVLETCQAL